MDYIAGLGIISCVLFVSLLNILGGEKHILLNHLRDHIGKIRRIFLKQRREFEDDRFHGPRTPLF